MSGILLSSQMDLYYNLRNVFLILFAILAVISTIYGIRIKIIVIIQKHFGIEKRREIARMQSGKGHSKKTSAWLKAGKQGGKVGLSGAMPENRGIDISEVTTMKLQMQQEVMPREEVQEITMPHDMQETMALDGEPGTVVLDSEPGTVVLDSEPGTVVLDGQLETMVLAARPEGLDLDAEPEIRFQKGKNTVIVHGEDIY